MARTISSSDHAWPVARSIGGDGQVTTAGGQAGGGQAEENQANQRQVAKREEGDGSESEEGDAPWQAAGEKRHEGEGGREERRKATGKNADVVAWRRRAAEAW